MSDFISENSRQKLENLAKDLTLFYPCQIQIHICSDSIFDGLPKLNGNYMTYFRFFMLDFMPKNLRLCLYLDVDMIVFKDLRELFSLDLEDKIAGVIKDNLCFAQNIHKKNKFFKDFYFNAGFLLLNLKAYKQENISKQCLSFLTSYKEKAILRDQDALNFAISKDKALIMPLEYNLLIIVCDVCIANDERKNFSIDYTRKEINLALLNPIILHFIMSDKNPWDNPYSYVDNKGKFLGIYWWDIALQTPQFKDEFEKAFKMIQKTALPQKEFENYVAFLVLNSLKSFFGCLKLPFVVYRVFKDKECGKVRVKNQINFTPNEQNLARGLFSITLKAYKKRYSGKLAWLLWRVLRIKARFERYGSAKITDETYCKKTLI